MDFAIDLFLTFFIFFFLMSLPNESQTNYSASPVEKKKKENYSRGMHTSNIIIEIDCNHRSALGGYMKARDTCPKRVWFSWARASL